MEKRIWSNEEYEQWEKFMLENGYEANEELYGEDCSFWLDETRRMLNIHIDGCIVAFANLGLWDGHHNGGKIIGDNIRDIFSARCDYATWFCDAYNVRCDATHHDGTNHIIYRIAPSRETAEKLVKKIAYNGMTEEQFRKATRSLKPFIAKVYGW